MPTIEVCPDDAETFWMRFVLARKPCLFQHVSKDLQPLEHLCTAASLRQQAVRDLRLFAAL